MPSGPMRRLTPRTRRSRTISPSALIVSTRSRSAPQHERFGIGSGRAAVPVWRGTARNGPVLERGAERVNQSREAKNKAVVLEAFEALFNKRDYTAAEGFWSPDYIQHSAHIGPGRDGLFDLIKSIPAKLKYEPGIIVADGDIVIVHGRFSGFGAPVNWIAADILRVQGGLVVEHWDVIPDEATRGPSKRGHPQVGQPVPVYS